MSPWAEEQRRFEGRAVLPEPEEEEDRYVFHPTMVVDEESRSAYIYLVPAKTERTLQLSNSVAVDLSSDGTVIGVELVGLYPEAITKLSYGQTEAATS